MPGDAQFRKARDATNEPRGPFQDRMHDAQNAIKRELNTAQKREEGNAGGRGRERKYHLAVDWGLWPLHFFFGDPRGPTETASKEYIK